jgi:hypothetical protein
MKKVQPAATLVKRDPVLQGDETWIPLSLQLTNVLQLVQEHLQPPVLPAIDSSL